MASSGIDIVDAHGRILAAQAAIADYPQIRNRFEAEIAAIEKKITAAEARQAALLKG